jgi:hypothetical protein
VKFGDLPFLAALLIVAAIALVGLAVVFLTGERVLAPLPFVVAVAFAAAYLYASHRPEESPASPPEEDEPFDDPVEEADRIDSVAPPTAPAATAPTPVGVPAAEPAGPPTEYAATPDASRAVESAGDDP